MKVGVYTRLSRDPEGTERAVRRQEQDCRARADAEGWSVHRVYVDNDISASNGKHRPAYEAMLTDLRSGVIAGAVFWKLDRLTRTPRQTEDLLDVCDSTGARLVSLHDFIDPSTPSGRMMLRQVISFAAMEADNTSMRLKRQRLQAAEEGRPHPGGLRPYGLTKDKRATVPEEAAVIQEAARRIVGGASLSGLVRELNRRGIVSSRGNPWTVTAFRGMITNPRLTGQRNHLGVTRASTTIPAILDAGTFEAVHAAIRSSSNGANGRKSERARALSGLLRCHRCGRRLLVKRRQSLVGGKQGPPLYRCDRQPPSCGSTVITAIPLEEHVGLAIAQALDTPALGSALDAHDDGLKALLAEQGSLHQRLDAVKSAYFLEGDITKADYARLKDELQARLASIESEIGKSHRVAIVANLHPGETIASAWETRPYLWRNQLAESLIERIVVHPVPKRGLNRFDPRRVEIIWRG